MDVYLLSAIYKKEWVKFLHKYKKNTVAYLIWNLTSQLVSLQVSAINQRPDRNSIKNLVIKYMRPCE